MRVLGIVIISLVAIGAIGTSYAVISHNDAVNIFGTLQIVEGNLVVSRTGGADSGLNVKNDGGNAVFQFFDVDDGQVYKFILQKDGTLFKFTDATHARTDLAIKTSNGNIGIGTTNPQSKLDVNGDLKVQGNILSNGDICIGSCP